MKKEEKTIEPTWADGEGQLVVDVYETEDELVVQSAIAGITSDDLNICLEHDILVMKGTRENPVNDKKKNYFVRDCYFGPFSKEIILPREVDTSKIKASIENGLLTIRMPKIEREQHKKISIKD